MSEFAFFAQASRFCHSKLVEQKVLMSQQFCTLLIAVFVPVRRVLIIPSSTDSVRPDCSCQWYCSIYTQESALDHCVTLLSVILRHERTHKTSQRQRLANQRAGEISKVHELSDWSQTHMIATWNQNLSMYHFMTMSNRPVKFRSQDKPLTLSIMKGKQHLHKDHVLSHRKY